MRFVTMFLPQACAAAQQVVTTYPGIPVSIRQVETESPTWEIALGPAALSPAADTHQWSWPDRDTSSRVYALVAKSLL